MHPRLGFTLIELMVVATIIVVLLALLTPALDKAVYQAELAACAARLDGVAGSITLYATRSNRRYPHRRVLAESGRWLRPNELAAANDNATRTDVLGQPAVTAAVGGRWDDRPILRDALGGSLATLLDPMCGKVDLDYRTQPVDTFGNYLLWFGMSYPTAAGGGQGMNRLGDRLEWTDNSRQSAAGKSAFSVLASDEDTRYEVVSTANSYWHLSSHPDRDAVLFFQPYQAATLVFSRWTQLTMTPRRGKVDLNYAFTDGSVARYGDVGFEDDRMANVPYDKVASGWGTQNKVWVHLPRH